MDEKTRVKIKKLFELANRSEGGEAETALKMANELLVQYGAKRSDVEFERIEVKVEKEQLEMKKEERFPNWLRTLFSMCGTNCGCVSVRTENADGDCKFTYIGDDLNVNVANELYNYLYGYVIRCANKFDAITEDGDIKIKESIVVGIGAKLKKNNHVWLEGKQRADEISTVLKKDMKLKHNSISVNSTINNAAYRMGKNVNLAKQTASGVTERIKIANRESN